MSLNDVSLTHRLSEQFADYVAPENAQVQAIVMRLVRALSHGDSCLTLTQNESMMMAGFSHPALVLVGDLLYLSRYDSYESQLSAALARLSSLTTQYHGDISQYFADEPQRKAAWLALTKSLAIITGGPGTGKTTTVVKILALLLQQNKQSEYPQQLRIALSAPTGKAAMRLSESIANSLSNPDVMKGFESVIDHIPQQAKTLHRLLGARPFSVEFRHNADNPLLEDVIVVDEASMIDLALMTKLVQSLKPTAKLILLGDKDQLASVESGSVLADCYQALQDNRIELQHTYRFGGKIKQLAIAVNQQRADEVIALLRGAELADPIKWQTYDDQLATTIHAHYRAYFERIQHIRTIEDIADCFNIFNSFQLLSPVRQGRLGVARLNQLAEKYLAPQEKWYTGRPVMIMQNDSNTQLYNGDIGLCLPSPDHQQQLRVFFLLGNDIRSFVPSRLPHHETAFAMTIHKSQGSEFGHVMILLPKHHNHHDASQHLTNGNRLDVDLSEHDITDGDVSDPTLMTKELLYTAITRSKQKVSIMAREDTIRAVVSTPVTRNSGLAVRLHASLSNEHQS